MLRDNIANCAPPVCVDLSFSESLLETWPVREAFLLFCLLVDPDAPTWRAWLGYRNCPKATTPLAPERNAGAYLRFLGHSDDQITAEAVEHLANEPRAKLRGSGGSDLWDRAKRFVELRNKFQSGGGSATELLNHVLLPDSWIDHSEENETAKVDMEMMRHKALEMVEDIVAEQDGLAAGEILQRLARQLRYQIATREPFASKEQGATLKVATLWGAKGVTAEHVYILGLCQEALPGNRRAWASGPGSNPARATASIGASQDRPTRRCRVIMDVPPTVGSFESRLNSLPVTQGRMVFHKP
jgi:superfamily I DNA/RNA helicase